MIERKTTRCLRIFSLILASGLLSPQLSYADTRDFGGSSESMRKEGDYLPPRCQLDVPRSAQSGFFIQWNCADDQTEPDDIRTTLWILRNGAQIPEKVKDFLGFPASVFVDASLLGVENVSDGLPAAFRLSAADRAGTTAISPYLTVLAQDNSVDTCSLELLTDPTESEGSTTGVPSRQVLLSNVSVLTRQVGNNDVAISLIAPVSANPCEIDEVCDDDENLVSFESSINFAETEGSTTASGSISVTPGFVLANVEGTAVVAESSLTSLEVTGDTTINGVATRATLSCSQ